MDLKKSTEVTTPAMKFFFANIIDIFRHICASRLKNI